LHRQSAKKGSREKIDWAWLNGIHQSGDYVPQVFLHPGQFVCLRLRVRLSSCFGQIDAWLIEMDAAEKIIIMLGAN